VKALNADSDILGLLEPFDGEGVAMERRKLGPMLAKENHFDNARSQRN